MTMAPDARITVIAHRMREYGEVRAMPIVEHGALAGIVTRGDILGSRGPRVARSAGSSSGSAAANGPGSSGPAATSSGRGPPPPT